MKNFGVVVCAAALASAVSQASGAALPRLKVSDGGHFLATEEGKPFFYLADTAWELFHRLDREEAVRYLDNRARLGFNVVQAVAIAEEDGVGTPNPYGFKPFADARTPVPLTKDGPDNDYWDHVDFVVDAANERGIYVALLPTWGRWWKNDRIFTADSARGYAEWLARRYGGKAVVWVLGGDRPVGSEEERGIIAAFAEGIRAGDGGRNLVTFHPCGGRGSSQDFHSAQWLDFNMWQHGHEIDYARYEKTLLDWRRSDPVKPVLDGESVYEGHPVAFNPDGRGHTVAADVRRALYWDVFNGACGHTYGHHSVWQMYGSKAAQKHSPRGKNRPIKPWHEAIDDPGAAQMRHAKDLVLSHPYFTRVPAPEMIVPHPQGASIVPGAGTRRFAAARDSQGGYAFVYVPVGREFELDLSAMKGAGFRFAWMNPRDGSYSEWTEFSPVPRKAFRPPAYGELLDWVLVIERAAALTAFGESLETLQGEVTSNIKHDI
jgi:hypothetical protein